jgi:hypothetical protein
MPNDRKPAAWAILAFVAVHFLARLASPQLHYFWETDDPAIAAGVAALIAESPGDTYRYAPQAGYYRVVEVLARLAGGVHAVPAVMVALSTLASLVVPLLAFVALPRETTARERFAWALVLAANPILFWSGRYGNTAMPSIALCAGAFVLLSRARSVRGELASLAFFLGAVWVRADAVLVAPAFALWLWHRHGAWRPLLVRVAASAAALVSLYASASLLDPRMQGMADEVGSHLTSVLFVSHCFDYMVLAFSPVPLFLAIWGMRDMADMRARLLALVAAWCVPTVAFYFLTLTTPRYFLALVFPLSLCGALGALELIDRGARWLPRALAATLAVAVAGAHMLVPVDRLSPRLSRATLAGAHDQTHDGPMHTGAFLYHAIVRGGFLRWSWRSGGFGDSAPFARTSRRALAALASAPAGRTVFVAVRGFPESAFYYELYRAGAVVVETGATLGGPADASHTAPTRWRLGASQLITAQPLLPSFTAIEALPLNPGDEVWFTRMEDQALILERVPYATSSIEGPGEPFIAARVVPSEVRRAE